MRTARRRRRTRRGRPRWGRLAALFASVAAIVVIVVVIVGVTAGGGSSSAPQRRFESMLQDDQLLVYNPSNTSVEQTLQTLKSLGVDRLRITVNWQNVAPDPNALIPPHFDAAQPYAYPATGWVPYDRIDLLAAKFGLKVDFDLSAPGPLWAAQANAHDVQVAAAYGLSGAAFAHVEHNFGLSAIAFGQFVQAVGRRYSGHYALPSAPGRPKIVLPRVNFWSVWNEPNQPGWLAPQFQQVGGRWVPAAPALYRDYVDAANAALRATGHGKDTLLIGELAPEGCLSGGICNLYPRIDQPLPPGPFVRALYCVNDRSLPLRGATATAIGCPASGSRAAFVEANPALFHATAFAHHPYSFALPPSTPLPEYQFFPLANLRRLERELNSVFAGYGVHRQIPLYLDEYGYETDPPNPIMGHSLADQSAWLDEATYMAARDPRVQGLSQFLLVDSPPNTAAPPGSRAYWSTFQTGLEFVGGQPKPSLYSYRLPIWLPGGGSVARGHGVAVWAMLRLAPNNAGQHASIEWSATGASYRPVGSVVTTNPNGIFSTRVHVPGSGYLRVRWTGTSGTAYYSRAASVTVSG